MFPLSKVLRGLYFILFALRFGLYITSLGVPQVRTDILEILFLEEFVSRENLYVAVLRGCNALWFTQVRFVLSEFQKSCSGFRRNYGQVLRLYHPVGTSVCRSSFTRRYIFVVCPAGETIAKFQNGIATQALPYLHHVFVGWYIFKFVVCPTGKKLFPGLEISESGLPRRHFGISILFSWRIYPRCLTHQ